MTKKKKVEEDRKKKIEIRVDADTKRLYGDINDAIKYMEEMRDQYRDCESFGLEEHWTGYEDMEMVFSYYREETDEEFASRLRDEKWKRDYAERERIAEEQRKADKAEYERLRSRLGYWR